MFRACVPKTFTLFQMISSSCHEISYIIGSVPPKIKYAFRASSLQPGGILLFLRQWNTNNVWKTSESHYLQLLVLRYILIDYEVIQSNRLMIKYENVRYYGELAQDEVCCFMFRC